MGQHPEKKREKFAKNHRPRFLAEVSQRIREGESSGFAIHEFLDEYYAALLADRPSFLAQCPDSVALPDPWNTQVIDAYLSAVAEALSYYDKFPAPRWVFADRFFLRDPWFASSIEGMKPLLLMESPVFFRRRNLFVSRNALSRA